MEGQNGQTSDALHNQTILRQRREIESLKKQLRKFIAKAKTLVEDDTNGASLNAAASSASVPDNEGRDESNEDSFVATAVWDDGDGVYRCTDCLWEVIDQFCQGCGRTYEHDMEYLLPHDPYSSISTNDEALVSDRVRAPRGTTPLLDIELAPEDVQKPPEYLRLLRRGGTGAMCERYKLTFTEKGGITARADKGLRELFAGPAIDEDDLWSIHLGRCIKLEEADTDGTQFIQDLLEEVLYFPLRSEFSQCIWERWETVQTDADVWVTRPILDRFEQLENSDGEDFWDDADDDTVGARESLLRDRALADESDEEVIQPDEYESTDEESGVSDGSDDEMEDADWTFQAGVSDAIYDPSTDSDMEDQLEEDCSDCAPVTKTELDDGAVAVKPEDPYDSADSDFDSEEELSGDEYVIASRK